ncbi:metallophosphoesterase [Flavilitoribacter nigricans]|uniref:metallophosphoesterase n=1 Tax=Flavilitoribacter nigricans TaxID=70997 RepID=UPI001476201F|nr:metallophosphoesterase [Flavilitoribacter nigricans]
MKLTLYGLTVLLLMQTNFLLTGQTTLVNYGANWSYFDGQTEPPLQGAQDWTDIGFDATSWSAGNAQLGYGDGDEATVVNSSTLTLYVRHEFAVADPAVFANLDLNLTYDDGAVVYLNGVEVWRVNMPTGTISYGTFAASTSSDNAQATANIANTLVSGNNVLAVEIHQRSTTSSDISFDLQMEGLPPGSVNVARGPYLQKSSPTRMVVKWRTSQATETVLDFGTTQGNLSQQYTENTPKTEHEVELTGLNPDTRYFYQLSNASVVLVPAAADLYFQTAPVTGTDQPTTVWVLGDCGTGTNNQRNVRDAYYNYIGSQHTDAILFLGDNAYNNGTDNEYQYAIFENMYEDKLKNSVSWSCLGNHDGYSANSSTQTGPYYDIFSFPTAGESGGMASGTEAYYSFDYGNIHFISLDSYDSDRSIGGAMYNWCLNDIQNTTQDWIVAFWHHPPYSKGSHDSDSETALVQMRQNFLPMLESNGVDLVLSGHSHSYERSYFLNGHYGNSDSFNSNTHTVGTTGAGDGRVNGTGAYEKTVTGPDAGSGAVYITAGSSGKVSAAALDHEAMYYSVAALGSCILEVDGDQMDVKFIRETGAVEDYFTINKAPQCTIGSSCDDGDACTINDVYNSDCNCEGTPVPDSDNDGICDDLDQCPGLDDNLIGQSCDDGDPCTTNDVYDSNCGCSGTPVGDADNDGYCDAIDQCAGLDDNLIGQSCDDGDACTGNDVYDSNCGCAGTPLADNDADGFCVGQDPDDNDPCVPDAGGQACDPCDVLISDGFEAGFGNWNDGGNDCSQIASNANSGNYSIRLRDGSGAASSIFTDPLDLSAFTEARIDLSFYPTGMESGEGLLLEVSTNGGGAFVVYQSWANGADFVNDTRYNVSVEITGIPFTGATVFRLRSNGSNNSDIVYIDDVVVNTCAVSCTEGAPCDDNDPCTVDDKYDAECNCIGTPAPDSDGDGVCDSLDQCPGQNDNLAGQACDDSDDCTTNDIYDSECNCTGTYTDNDNDGFCIGQDPDDNDGCNPDPNSGACSPCSDIIADGFESGFGNWNSGGADCERTTSYPNTGSYSIRLRDGSGSASSLFTNNLDLSAYQELELSFYFYAFGMDTGESFSLEVSTNGGSTYTTYRTWESEIDFVNGISYQESVLLSGLSFSNNTRLRFICNGSNNGDQVYLDDITVSNCGLAALQALRAGSTTNFELSEDIRMNTPKLKVYPTPADQQLYLEVSGISNTPLHLKLYNTNGQIVIQRTYPDYENGVWEVEMGDLPAGLYFLQLSSDREVFPVQRVIIGR